MAVATLTHDPLDGRQRVLNAAAERFVAQGYAATTLRQIAADVGIKAGSIYHHFPSKDALIESVFKAEFDNPERMPDTSILESPGPLVAIGAANGLGLACGISGIAVGLGATFPNFKVDNAARVAGGPAGILFMVSALTLVGVVIALEAYPVYLLLRTQYTGEALTGPQWGVSAILCTIAAVCCAIATVYPIKRAAPGLWERNL